MADQTNFEDEFKEMLGNILSEAERDLDNGLDEVAAYAKERASHLAAIAGESGFADAVVAERDNVLMNTALTAVLAGDEVDERIRGAVQGALHIAAKAAIAAL